MTMDYPPLVLSYAGPDELTDQMKAGRAAAIATVVSAGVVARIFFHLRLEVVRAIARNWGSWCGTPIVTAESNLYGSGFLLIIPAALWFTAWRYRAYPRLTRIALVGAAATWLVCVASL